MPTSTRRQQRVPPATGRGSEPKQAADGEDRVSAPPVGEPVKQNPRGRGVSKDARGIDVTILDRKFRIACSQEEEAGLLRAVEYLDAKMREIRDGGKPQGMERIAVTAALNIAHELLTVRVGGSFDIGSFKRRITSMAATLEEALSVQDKLF